MITKLRFSNFYSFAGETELSFELGKKPSCSSYDIEIPSGRRLNKVAAVIGANGSGKTQLIKPLAFLSWFVSESLLGSDPEADIPFQPHACKREQDTELEISFLLGQDEYRYRIIINRRQVLHESLHRKTSHLFSYIFVRDLKDNDSDGKPCYSYKQKGFGFSAPEAKKTRGNASLISRAHNFDVELASKLVKYFESYSYNLNVSGRHHFHSGKVLASAEFFYKNKQLNSRMVEILCGFDMGLSSVAIDETEVQDQQGNSSKIFMPFGVHAYKETEFKLPFFEESSGTQSAFVLLHRILPVLENGGLAIIDEIDNDLHPHMLPHILELFKFEHTNPHQAQIIFTCHTPEVLNLLMKHQVYLVEKEGQESDAWRLDDVVGLRSVDNLYAKYMAGALSAVPNF
ncbi:MAG: abortive infection protein [Thiotrichales bacterium]|nr:MAG: abortive infection protein [Thiotrichales bacterium]